MLRKNVCHVVIIAIVLSFIGCLPQIGKAATYKVLVVMSYHEDMYRVKELKKGIESVLRDSCELKYVYLDMRRDAAGGKEKAQEAYALYQEFQPDGVIAADNEAHSLFVIPYLRDKVDTPVIFCGVNVSAEKYGYPASNVTGVIEYMHITESILFAQQLEPTIKTFGLLMGDLPKARSIFQQIQSESETYTAEFVTNRFVKTFDEAVAVAKELKTQCDALFIASMDSLPDSDGNPLPAEEVVPVITQTFGKPVIVPNSNPLKRGALCAVVEIIPEQGSIAAEMLLKAMEGTPISELSITRNKKGKRMLNVTVMKSLGIKPKPIVLKGVKLVETEE